MTLSKKAPIDEGHVIFELKEITQNPLETHDRRRLAQRALDNLLGPNGFRAMTGGGRPEVNRHSNGGRQNITDNSYHGYS